MRDSDGNGNGKEVRKMIWWLLSGAVIFGGFFGGAWVHRVDVKIEKIDQISIDVTEIKTTLKDRYQSDDEYRRRRHQ